MRKKLFAVIMSIMMMVTFMPTMAFATPAGTVTDVDWTVTNSGISAVVSYTVGGVAHKPMKVESGEMTFTFIDDSYSGEYSSYIGATIVELPTTLYWGTGDTVDYTTVDSDTDYSNDSYAIVYDFTNASIVKWDETHNKDRIMRIDADTYCNMVDQNGKLKAGYGLENILGSHIKFVQPAITMEDGGTPKAGHLDYTNNLMGFGPFLGTKRLSTSRGVSAPLIIADAKLPTYEKYQEDKNFSVTLSLTENQIIDCSKYGIFFLSLDKAVSEHQVYIYSGANSTIDFTMGETAKTINLSSEAPTLDGLLDGGMMEAMNAIVNAITIGFYNGESQTLQATTKGVKVEYSTDFGRTYGAAPTLKNASLSYMEFIMAYAVASGQEDELGIDAEDVLLENLYEKILDNLVYVKVTKGDNAPQYGMVVPMILPREFIVEYKSKELNFEPGTDVTAKDALRAKALKGYDAIVDVLMEYELNDTLNIQKALGLLGTSRTDICATDKAAAEKFVEKYFELRNMPTSGTGNKVEFAKNVYLDINALLNDVKTDAELAAFMNNYDILPELLLMIDQDVLNADYKSLVENESIIEALSGEGSPAIQYLLYGKLGTVLVPALVKDLQSRINTTATVNFVETKITAKNKTKTYHIKNATALKSKKTFTYKATSNTGKVTFKKLSGNKKITIAKNGKVTVKKGLKKGTYTTKVRVSSNGKKVTKKITVKIVK